MTPRKFSAALLAALAITATHAATAEELFHLDFSNGAPGDDVLVEQNALPEKFPSNMVTSIVKAKDLSFRLAKDGALPGQYGLYTDASAKSNGSFVFRWGDDAEGVRVATGTLTMSWKMNFVSGSDSDVTFEALRPDLPKESGRLARFSVSAAGQIKMGGSKDVGAENDNKIAKNFTLNAPHSFVWTLDYATGQQTLKIDDGAILDYNSAKVPTQNFYTKAPAVAFKVDIRGNDAVVAIGDVSVKSSAPATKP